MAVQPTRPARKAGRRLAVALAVALITAGTALAAALDGRSDRTALGAYRSYLSALVSGAATGRSHDAALVASVRGNCARVLASLGSNRHVDQSVLSNLGEEIGGDLDLTFLSEATGPFATLSHRVAGLRWSNASTRATVGAYLAAERAVLSMAPAHLCADARAVAAHPRTTPAGMSSFLSAYLSGSNALHGDLNAFLQVLGRYETLSEHHTVDEIDSLASRFASITSSARQTGAGEILAALGLKSG